MLLMIFASHHRSARHALSLRLGLGSELIDLAFQPPSLRPSRPFILQPDPGEAGRSIGHHRLFTAKLRESQSQLCGCAEAAQGVW